MLTRMDGRSVRTVLFAATVAAALATAGAAVAAEPLPQPRGPVILTVSGKIRNTNAGGEARLDFAMLQALAQHEVRTTTPWTDGEQTFTGVLMRDLMALVGAFGEEVRAIALNNYGFVIDLADFTRYPVLLAHTQNGQRLRIRDKGPLWIVYPRDDFDELGRRAVEPRMVWQLQRLVVQ